MRERVELNQTQFIEWTREFNITLRMLFAAPHPPVWFARVAGREDDEERAWLWFNPARSSWVVFFEDECTEEVRELFSGC